MFTSPLLKFNETNHLPKWVLITFSLVMVFLIGVADYLNGIEINLAILYLLPILFLALYVGRTIAILVSLLSAVEWFLADFLYGHVYSNPWIPYWNALVWFSFFIIFVLIITALKKAMHEERRLSRHDFLTGVFNRRAFFEILQNELQRSIRYNHPLTVAYLDCDNFKQINDIHGHKTGDLLLKFLAETISNNLRNVDILARLGGDEFIILLPESNFNSANIVLKKIQKVTTEMFKRNRWPVTLSIGACTFTEPPLSVENTIQHVDKLMYEAKKAGKNRINHVIN